MWAWWLVGWFVVAGGVAALHHRLRRQLPAVPPEVAAFLVRFENELAANHPGVDYLGLLPDRFACLLRIDGQETAVGLHDALRHAEAYPEAFGAMVARLLQDVREVGLDRVGDVEFASAAARLLPQVRSRAWVEAQGRFGPSALVHRPLNDQLAVVYVLDDEQTMVFVCRAHLQHWRRSEADLHSLALANLAARGRPAGDAPAQVFRSGDGYDAARALLLEQQEGLLVAVPDRDTLWVGQAAGQDLASLMATTAAIAADAAHPVAPQVFRVTAGRLEPVAPPR